MVMAGGGRTVVLKPRHGKDWWTKDWKASTSKGWNKVEIKQVTNKKKQSSRSVKLRAASNSQKWISSKGPTSKGLQRAVLQPRGGGDAASRKVEEPKGLKELQETEGLEGVDEIDEIREVDDCDEKSTSTRHCHDCLASPASPMSVGSSVIIDVPAYKVDEGLPPSPRRVRLAPAVGVASCFATQEIGGATREEADGRCDSHFRWSPGRWWQGDEEHGDGYRSELRRRLAAARLLDPRGAEAHTAPAPEPMSAKRPPRSGDHHIGRRRAVGGARAAAAAVAAATAAMAPDAGGRQKSSRSRHPVRQGALQQRTLRAMRPARPSGGIVAGATERRAREPDASDGHQSRKKRRTIKTRGAAGAEAEAGAAAAFVATPSTAQGCGSNSRPTAAKSAPLAPPSTMLPAPAGIAAPVALPGAPPASAAYCTTVPRAGAALATTAAQSENLNEAEQHELKEAVLAQLHRVIGGEVEDAEVLAEFILVLVDQHKTRAEMAAELAFFQDESEPFVAWVEERKASILARRLGASGLSRPPLKAQLTPNPVTASLEGSSSATPALPAAAMGDTSAAPLANTGKSFVVITDRLVLQPNSDIGESGCGNTGAGIRADNAPSANDRKMELLAEMTKKLQEILGRLSDKTLDDESREKYQSMAQSIQAQLNAFSRPARS